MSLPKINHTQISNYFIDEIMPNVSPAATKCFLIISRKTIGWHKDRDQISLSQFEKLTGMTVNTIKNSLKELLQVGIITYKRTGNGKNIKTFFELNYTFISNIDTIKPNISKIIISTIDIITGSNISKIDTIKNIISKIDTIKAFNISKIDTTKEKEKESGKSKEKNIKKPDSKKLPEMVIKLTQHFYDQIQKYVQPPTFKNKAPNLKKWAEDIEKLNRIDKIDFSDIKRVIDFTVKDSFWSNHVLSGKKLRVQFNTLYLKMNNSGNYKETAQDISDYWDNRDDEFNCTGVNL
jgi:phage replication O-like protein O